MSEALNIIQDFRAQLGEFETDADYAERFATQARKLGATKAYVI